MVRLGYVSRCQMLLVDNSMRHWRCFWVLEVRALKRTSPQLNWTDDHQCPSLLSSQRLTSFHPVMTMKAAVALYSETFLPRLFLVFIISYALDRRAVLRLPLFTAQPRFRDRINKLVATTDGVIIAHSRNISASSKAQRTQPRLSPVSLSWSVSQRASRDINIQASIECVTSLLLLKFIFSSHTIRQSWEKQWVEYSFHNEGQFNKVTDLHRILASALVKWWLCWTNLGKLCGRYSCWCCWHLEPSW